MGFAAARLRADDPANTPAPAPAPKIEEEDIVEPAVAPGANPAESTSPAPPAVPVEAGASKADALAVVAGAAISEADVRERAKSQLLALEREYESNRHQILEEHLQAVVRERLLETEAKTRGIPKEQVLAAIHGAPVSDVEVDQFYEANQERIAQPKAQVADQIRQYLGAQRSSEAVDGFYDGLERKYGVRILLEPMRFEVAAKGPARGPAGAAVTIVEFSDFQCPFCARIEPTLKQVLARYGERVRLVYRQFPLAMHPDAEKAAEAALCADAQGKFWELHDAMFGNQQALAVDALKATAALLGVDAAAFATCLDSGAVASAVAADLADGQALGVSGTPAMFVNGRLVSGAVPIEQITTVIDDELARQSKASKPSTP